MTTSNRCVTDVRPRISTPCASALQMLGKRLVERGRIFANSALRVEDLADMNDREKLELVTKDNVWPSRSLADYRESGVDAMSRAFRPDDAPRVPYRTLPNLVHVEIYVDMARKLQDLAARLKTKADLSAFRGRLGQSPAGWCARSAPTGPRALCRLNMAR
ncbi:hypothetical protein ACTMU2_14130 [Cupriavidus basilensis]